MSAKVIPGSSREALQFIAAHWAALLKMSLVPLLAYLVVMAVQIRSLATLYRSMGGMVAGQTPGPEFFGAYMRGMALSMLGSIVAACLFGILFAQIVRFRRSGFAPWIPADKASLSAGLMTLVYGLGIAGLTLLFYIAAVLVFTIVVVIIAVLASAFGDAANVIAAVLTFAGALALLASLLWFSGRYLVGLPGVALGSSPDFFKDMWPLARGESWAVPLRLVAATLVVYVPIIIVFAVFMGPAWLDMMRQVADPANAGNPNLVFPLMADMLDHIFPASAVMILFYMPFMWFTALLLAIAFERFRARDQAASA
ncbi:MAG: hypothetical protein U1E15_13395 [Hyphomicrobiales bacterium]